MELYLTSLLMTWQGPTTFLFLVTSQLLCEYLKHPQIDIYISVLQCNSKSLCGPVYL